MPRALSMRQSRVSRAERDGFRARARETATHYARAGCNYWVFEARDTTGAFVEFFEAPDADTLERAHGSSQDPAIVDAPVYVQLELN